MVGDGVVANDALSQKTSIWRALGSRLRSKTVQFKQARRELPHSFRGARRVPPGAGSCLNILNECLLATIDNLQCGTDVPGPSRENPATDYAPRFRLTRTEVS
jgi:hypothetical protein